jgi:hypothetical protein
MNLPEYATPSRRLVWVLALTLLLSPARLCSADDNPLLNLVSSDAALVVEVNKLRLEADRLMSSNLLSRIQNHPAFRSWTATREFQSTVEKWNAAEKKFGRPTRDVLLDFVGSRIVLAAYISNDKEENQSTGVFLTEIGSRETLDALLAAFVEFEVLSVESRMHAGAEYSAGVRRDKSRFYWCRLPTVFAWGESESAIRQVLERHSAPDPLKDSFQNTEVYRLARKAAGESPICVVLSPQPWNKTLNIDGMLTSDDDVERLVGAAWKQLRSVSLSAGFENGAAGSLHVHFEPIPPAMLAGLGLLRWFDQTKSADRVPADALAAAGFTLDAASALNALIQLEKIHLEKNTKPGEDQSLTEFMGLMKGWFAGREFSDVVKGLGTDVAVYAVPASETSPLLVDLLLEWPFVTPPSDSGGEWASLHQDTHDYAVNYSLTLLSFGLNIESKGRYSTHVQIQKTSDLNIRWLEGWPFAQPAGAAASDRFILATSPAAIRNHLAGFEPSRSLAGNSRFRRAVRNPRQHFVYWNVAATVQFLRRNSQAIANYVARIRGRDSAEMSKRIERLADLVDVVDVAAVSVRLADDHIRVDFAAQVDPTDSANR